MREGLRDDDTLALADKCYGVMHDLVRKDRVYATAISTVIYTPRALYRLV